MYVQNIQLNMILIGDWILNIGLVRKIKSVLDIYLTTSEEIGRYRTKKKIEQELEEIVEDYESIYLQEEIEVINDEEYSLDTNFRIEWKTETSRESFLENNEVVLCLNDESGNPWNITKATVEYVRRSLIPHTRIYIDSGVSRALDYFVSMELLENSGNKDSKLLLFEGYLASEIEQDSDIQKNIEKLDNLKKACYIHILLKEYERLSRYGLPNKNIRESSSELLDFLNNMAMRERNNNDVCLDDEFLDVCVVHITGNFEMTTHMETIRDRLADFSVFYLIANENGEKILNEVADNLYDEQYIEDHEFYELNHPDYNTLQCVRFERKRLI